MNSQKMWDMWHGYWNTSFQPSTRYRIEKEEIMYPKVATAYDQNPARIRIIVRKNSNIYKKQKAYMFHLMITVIVGMAYAANYLFT